jgi:predicted dehydrogenase
VAKSPINIGMIGAGSISAYHIAGLRQAGARVGAIAARTLESAQRRAQEFGIPRFMADYHDILADPSIDAVVIATPDYLHMPHAIDALCAGKPTLLQKPMARNTDECVQIIRVADGTGVPLYVSFMHRYFEEVELMRNLLNEGALGQVLSVRQRNATPGADWAGWFYHKENVGGGVLLQLGVHGIDLLRHVFGEIVSVRATTARMIHERTLADGTVIHPDAEDLVIATYRFASGMIAVHESSYTEVAGTDRFRMEVYGTAGTAWLRTERGRLAIYAPDYIGQKGWLVPDILTDRVEYRQHRHFLDMLTGDAPPDHSAHDGLVSLRVIEAVYRAAETSTWEAVEVDA